jgi:hypothetical protein
LCYEELERCKMAYHELAVTSKNPSETRIDFLSREFRPPSLGGITAACAAVASYDPRLVTARLVADRLSGQFASDPWAQLYKLGYFAAGGGHGAYPCAVSQIIRFIQRDLMCLVYGRTPFPRWRRDIGELSLNDVVLKKIVVGKARHQATILDQFQEEGWPRTILVCDDLSQVELDQALKGLRKGLKGGLWFGSADSGAHVYWDLTE